MCTRVTDLRTQLGSVPSKQSREHGYLGTVDNPAVYAFSCNITGRNKKDSGPNFNMDPQLNTVGQADTMVEYNYNKRVFDSEQNFKRATLAGLNIVIPKAYYQTKERGGGVETQEYRTTDSLLDIITELCCLYKKLTLRKRDQMESKWALT
jgi:hypothetical protein